MDQQIKIQQILYLTCVVDLVKMGVDKDVRENVSASLSVSLHGYAEPKP